ncbi:unnamed protein product [Psylliodes chrysocephalus]|uniref:BPTI/Kunitz inhibitor domain-containing protein n=1 Tax=Psylliodes chrysocephalus TaxID=3402493 RepID=A0A9P0CZ03_9CUCU|nr:unnamed protein product [Psylliodes chrysocephala]
MYKFNYYFLTILFIVQVYCDNVNFDKHDCFKPHTAGFECKALAIRYHWNHELAKCEQVAYGGCGATNNNFETLESCEKIAGGVCKQHFKKADCFKPHTAGFECRALAIRYHWNHELAKCEQVAYGGCGATNNNFETLESCKKIAGGVCKEHFEKADCFKPHTPFGQSCTALIPRYHWNHRKARCEKVLYGGCRATNNNFITMKRCQKVAGTICRQR